MDREAIERVRRKLKEIALSEGIDLESVIIFGSRVTDDYTKGSDIDILLVSDGFDGMRWYKRPGVFYRKWDYKGLPEPEFICLTLKEFKEKKKMKTHIVREAVKTGVAV